MGRKGKEDGLALVSVLLIMLVLMAVGAFVILAVQRSTETRVAYQNQVAGFYAAEAGVNRGAGRVRNIFLGFGVPTGSDCDPHEFTINERTVRYQLTGCGQSPVTRTLPTGDPFEGLNAIVYTYDLRSEATNRWGYSEAAVRLRFESRLIPMFQFAAFYRDDLELTVGPPMRVNGRMHTNRNMYLNTHACSDPFLTILGNLTIVGDLYRGRKDSNSNFGKIRIAKRDGTLQTLGVTGPGDESCPPAWGVARRLVPAEEVALWEGRIDTNVRDVALPGQQDLLCAPWSCPPGQQPGSYWQKADLRIVLDRASNRQSLRELCERFGVPVGSGPALWPVRVVDASGAEDTVKQAALCRLMVEMPGVITYNDVPRSGWDCAAVNSNEDRDNSANYLPELKCTPAAAGEEPREPRGPRRPINGLRGDDPQSNYCYDYRYGGFYNWRERKPILMLNVDWMALEEWNQRQPSGARLFDPDDTTEGGLVVFLSVRGPNSRGANNYAVRVYDAQRLRFRENSPGVTFASDVAFYVAGNFNCADPAEAVQESSEPMPCGPGDPRDRRVGKRPAAIVADTINVLSCEWLESGTGDPWDASGACRNRFNFGVYERNPGNWGDPDCDGQSDRGGRACPYRPRDELSTSRSAPRARRSVVNAAFLAGNDLTWCPGNDMGVDCGYDWYSGGLENYPRFHECWASCNRDGDEYLGRFWYEGSLVALEHPKHTCWGVQRGWVADDPDYSCRREERQGFWRRQRYSPPQRRWFYDVSFNDAANLPPLSPRFVSLKLRWFTEEFR
jgi:hypothetical protein